MDADRFAAEVPRLFDDFPRSPVPAGRRFADVIEGIPNLATENVLALLNLAASLLDAGESYVEVGSFFGASLIGAMRGNEGDFVAIDRFSFDVPEVRGRHLPKTSRAGLEESLAVEGVPGRWGVEGRRVTFLPDRRLPPGTYRLVVDARLEDLCGNNFIRPFETPSGSTPLPSERPAQVVRPFTVP